MSLFSLWLLARIYFFITVCVYVYKYIYKIGLLKYWCIFVFVLSFSCLYSDMKTLYNLFVIGRL